VDPAIGDEDADFGEVLAHALDGLGQRGAVREVTNRAEQADDCVEVLAEIERAHVAVHQLDAR
jgi:hypothetical protein